MNLPEPAKPSLYGFLMYLLWMYFDITFGDYRKPPAITEVDFRSDYHGPYIYFLRGNRRIKIGYTRSVIERVNVIQGMSPANLELICVAEGGELVEREIHERFKSIRLYGEWFMDHPEIYRFINLAYKNQ